MIAKEIMSRGVVTIQPETTITEIIDILIEKNIGAVPVVDSEDKIIGIVSENDLISDKKLPVSPLLLYRYKEYEQADEEIKLSREKLCKITAVDVMATGVITADENAPVEDIAHLIIEKRIKQVPIVSDGTVVGMVRRRDILKEIFRLVCWI